MSREERRRVLIHVRSDLYIRLSTTLAHFSSDR
jgi:hypothetical protein